MAKCLSTVRKRPRVQTVNLDPEVTVQSDGPRTEIRSILAKYQEVGIIDHMREVDLQFRDVTEFEDFRDVMVQAKVAENAFLRLPPAVRDLFDNDVARWLDAAHDPEKIEAMRPKLEATGFLKPKVAVDPEPARVIVDRRKAAASVSAPAVSAGTPAT